MYNSNLKIIIILSLTFLTGQNRIGQWGALTSVLEVRDIVNIDGHLYAATGGGVFHINDNNYSVFTKVDQLEGVDINAIAVDFKSHIWIGGNSPNGFIQVYDPASQKSIEIFDFGMNLIKDIKLDDKKCWVLFKDGQDFGLMKFVYNKNWEYRESYVNYPENGGLINCFTANDSIIYAGMTNGLYSAKISSNMKDPNNWEVLIPEISGSINSIVLDNGKLIFSKQNKIYTFDISSEVLDELDFSFELINPDDIYINSEEIWFADEEKIFLKKNTNDFLIHEGLIASSFNQTSDGIIAGLSNGYLFINFNSNQEIFTQRLIPNTPATGNFSSITVLNDGRLVGGSGNGISIYDGYGWRNILEIKVNGSISLNNQNNYNFFIADTVPFDFGEYIADMEQGPDGLLYCAIRGSRVYSSNPPRWSGGVLVIDVDDPSNITAIDTTFLSYHTSSGNSIPYQVTLDIEFDNQGNLWIANPYCINGNNPIHVRSLDGIWKHYGSNETSTRISQSPSSITFDDWGRVWVSSFQAEEANLGIYPNGGISYLAYEGFPYNPTNFFWNIIQYSGTVWSLEMGMNSRLYYLTPSGLNYYDLNNNPNAIVGENLYPYFPNISFGTGAGISIDPNGNIWTHSPSQGVHVLLQNTSYWPDINGFRMHNSPLLSDEVRDIDFDENRNLAYIATSKGINVLRIPFGKPKLDFNDVKIFPSPFFLPSEKPMIIDGLIYLTSAIITTLDGKVVRHIYSSGLNNDGDQLLWDGKDEKGDYVSSGVYLILIYNGDNLHQENKITVISR